MGNRGGSIVDHRGYPAVMSIRGMEILAPVGGRGAEVLTPEALAFLSELHRRFEGRRQGILRARVVRQGDLDHGALPDFDPATAAIREGSWTVPPAPADLQDRRVEITGPVERKMMINALNSGAQVFMADFEDANSPTWTNVVQGQVNVRDAVRRTLEYRSPEGKEYRLVDRPATLVVRPRGWHLVEKHLRAEGQPMAAGLVDAGLFLFHNARDLVARGSGPYLYLPKLEGAPEAHLWADVLDFVEEYLVLRRGTVRATVLIENILAAFEMEEILHALGSHATALNAGRWDYIFSIIRKFRHRPGFVLPDRAQVTMAVPFMRAYTELLVRTCHRRGAHAIGGMAAFIPSRRDPRINEVALARVREDKVREAGDGFDGTWVAHPDLVPVARAVFQGALGGRPNQLHRMREDVAVGARDLLAIQVPGGEITETGLRSNIDIAILYLRSWLGGVGAAALYNLMEDAATAEIARSQVWQWVRHGAYLREGRQVTRELVRGLEAELLQLHQGQAQGPGEATRWTEACAIVDRVALGEDFVEFLTEPAYEHLA